MDVLSNYLTLIFNYGKLTLEVRNTLHKDNFVRAGRLLQASVENLPAQADLASKRAGEDTASVKEVSNCNQGHTLIPKKLFAALLEICDELLKPWLLVKMVGIVMNKSYWLKKPSELPQD